MCVKTASVGRNSIRNPVLLGIHKGKLGIHQRELGMSRADGRTDARLDRLAEDLTVGRTDGRMVGQAFLSAHSISKQVTYLVFS